MIFSKTVDLAQEIIGYTKTTDGGMYINIRSGYNYPDPAAPRTLAADGETLIDTQKFVLIADKTVHLNQAEVRELENGSVSRGQTLGEALAQALASLMILKGEIVQ